MNLSELRERTDIVLDRGDTLVLEDGDLTLKTYRSKDGTIKIQRISQTGQHYVILSEDIAWKIAMFISKGGQ